MWVDRLQLVFPVYGVRLLRSATRRCGKLIQYIIGNQVWWFQVWMGKDNPDLVPLASWRDSSDGTFQPVPDVAPLVARLESS